MVHDIPNEELIKKTTQELKKIDSIKPLEWSKYCKTGHHKERPPIEKDWWYTRAASILNKTANLGPIGVSKLRRKYGGKKNRGYKPEKVFKGSGNITRKILQQLEKAGLVKQTKKKGHKGRIITKEGILLLKKSENGTRKDKGAPRKIEAPTTNKTT